MEGFWFIELSKLRGRYAHKQRCIYLLLVTSSNKDTSSTAARVNRAALQSQDSQLHVYLAPWHLNGTKGLCKEGWKVSMENQGEITVGQQKVNFSAAERKSDV